VERFEDGSDMSGFRSLNNSTSKRVLNLLEAVKLTAWKVMIERVTVVKFRVSYGGGNGAIDCADIDLIRQLLYIHISRHFLHLLWYNSLRQSLEPNYCWAMRESRLI